jgi:predicted RNA-binding Zn ribbon-like protein
MTRLATPSAFQLNGGHPALDFVNTLDDRFRADGPVELLESYADLLRFLQQSGLLSAHQARLLDAAAKKGAAARVLQSARELRETMAAVLYSAVDGGAPGPAHLRALENHFLLASRHRQLRWQLASKQSAPRTGANWVWGRFETDVELPVWMLAQSAAELMTSSALDQLRACGSETCRWLFLDTSKNHSRRWCNMKICGNRMKARRFTARRQA